MNICVYGAASDDIHPDYLAAGQQMGALLAQGGHTLVFGGGAHGMMGAVARGAAAGGGDIVGVVPTFFDKPGVLFRGCRRMIFTQTMRQRKQQMEDESDAFIVTPGGAGTFEEFFEIFTLRVLGRHAKPIALLNTRGYYDALYGVMRQAAQQGFMRGENLALCALCDAPQQALEYVTSRAGAPESGVQPALG